VDTVFGYPGGQIIPLYDALPEFPIRHILVRHEQGAAHAADGYARASGRVGVCLATSGPGATNLVTGLANAMVDSVPIVAVTGQVPRASLGCDAFQEADLTGITLPVVKHSYLVKQAADIPRIVKEAFHIAITGRPGPVLIDLPRDVQEAGCEFRYPESVDLPGYRPNYDAHLPQINRAARVISSSKSPVILAGGGVIISGATDVLLALAHKAGIPVVSTLLGLGAFPAGDPLFLGMAGMHGSVVANRALAETDLLIAVGTRFSDRVTGPAELFAPHARIIHIDIDPAEVGKNIRVDLPVVADARRALEALLGSLGSWGDRGEWLRQIAAWRAESVGRPRKHAARGQRIPGGSGGPRLSPTDVMDRLAGRLDGREIVVTDVGQHQMWAAQRLPRERPRTFLSSGGLGTMGYGLPAALGAKVACPNVPVILVTGDGSFQMSLQQLATIKEENLDVKIVLLNNGYLGMVRQWQDLFYRKRYSAVALGPYPDFCRLARAYGLRAARASTLPALDKALPKIMSDDGPALLECRIEPEANVFPIIPPGRGVAETMLHAD
jgi:acetolactate synthase-1/2/3 large subunit